MTLATAELRDELRTQRRPSVLPGSYRVTTPAGVCVLRYIADHRGLLWAQVYDRHVPAIPAGETPDDPRVARYSPLGWALELVSRGELELVRIPDDPRNAYAL